MKSKVPARGCCTKCGSSARILVYRREGASGTRKPEPETWLCSVCCGERPEPRERS